MKIDLDLLQEIFLCAESGQKYYNVNFPCAYEYKFKGKERNDLKCASYIHSISYLENFGFIDHQSNNTMSSLSGYFSLTTDGQEFLRLSRMDTIPEDDWKRIFYNSILTDLSNKIKRSYEENL